MARVNKTLLLSLRQDLKILDNVSVDILKELKSFELNSWLYPRKSFREVSSIIVLNGAIENNQYLSFLENVIDRFRMIKTMHVTNGLQSVIFRLYLTTHLFVSYVEKFVGRSKTFTTPKNVVRPPNLSLGSSIELLWRSLREFDDCVVVGYEYGSKDKVEDTSKSTMAVNGYQKINADTQTQICSLNRCDSCTSATDCIKQILEFLEGNGNCTNLKTFRRSIREDIVNITQHGCMNRITSAIVSELSNFAKQLRNTEEQNTEFELKLEDVAAKYEESFRIIGDLERDQNRIRRDHKKMKVNNKNLVKRANELTQLNEKQKGTIEMNMEKIEVLERSIENSTISIALLSSNNDRLLKDFQRVFNKNVDVVEEKNTWKKRFTETYLDNRNLKNEIEELHRSKSLRAKIYFSFERLSEKLEESNAVIENKTKILENFVKTITDVVDSQQIKGKSDDTVASFKVKGNPLTDMQQQVKVNQATIQKLQLYNANLQRTIQRIKEKQTGIIPNV